MKASGVYVLYAVIYALWLLWCPALLLAQIPVHLGAKAGMNLSSISGDYDSFLGEQGEDLGYRTVYDFHLGLVLKFKVPKVAVQPELLYSRQGFHARQRSGFTRGSERVQLSYFCLPVMLRYYLIPGLHIGLGPQFGVLVDKSTRTQYQQLSSLDPSEISDLDELRRRLREVFKEDIRPYDMGGAIGFGFDSPTSLAMEARYILGFFSLQEDSDLRAFNRVLQVSILYYFN